MGRGGPRAGAEKLTDSTIVPSPRRRPCRKPISSPLRTAGGRKGGRLKGWHPTDLSAQVLTRSSTAAARIRAVRGRDRGCVQQVGEQAGNVARNAVMRRRLPESVPGTSIDRQCGSSQQALHFAAQAVMSGTMDIVIAGGVESMTRVPMRLVQPAAGAERLRQPKRARPWKNATRAWCSASSPAPK